MSWIRIVSKRSGKWVKRTVRRPRRSAPEHSLWDLDWDFSARADQRAPDQPWQTWLILGGRGSGKTRSGAEWVLEQVRQGAKNIALMAPTIHDAREVMLGGESGLLNIGFFDERPTYQPTRRRLVWPDMTGEGRAIGYLFSAHEPDRLRGPQFDCAWGDEFCAWSEPDAVLSNLRLGLRLGRDPKLCLTTTPRPIKALDRLISEAGTVTTRSRTLDNASRLAPGFLKSVTDLFGGTALGRQELDGYIVRDHAGAIFERAVIDKARVDSAPRLERILIGLDPSATSGPLSDACGIIVVGRDKSGPDPQAYVLADATLSGATPLQWAQKAVQLFHIFEADAILAETNQGGEMISTVLGQIDANVPVISRHAVRSKSSRALPVSLLYQKGRVHHVGTMDALEDELCAFGGPNQSGSPDRMDALVWAVSELLLGQGEPKLRFL